jgi:hypothetical protein
VHLRDEPWSLVIRPKKSKREEPSLQSETSIAALYIVIQVPKGVTTFMKEIELTMRAKKRRQR